MVFALKKLHKYLFGRNYSIVYDPSKPLSTLFSVNKGIPQIVSGRIQRWALTLYNDCPKYTWFERESFKN